PAARPNVDALKTEVTGIARELRRGLADFVSGLSESAAASAASAPASSPPAADPVKTALTSPEIERLLRDAAARLQTFADRIAPQDAKAPADASGPTDASAPADSNAPTDASRRADANGPKGDGGSV